MFPQNKKMKLTSVIHGAVSQIFRSLTAVSSLASTREKNRFCLQKVRPQLFKTNDIVS